MTSIRNITEEKVVTEAVAMTAVSAVALLADSEVDLLVGSEVGLLVDSEEDTAAGMIADMEEEWTEEVDMETALEDTIIVAGSVPRGLTVAEIVRKGWIEMVIARQRWSVVMSATIVVEIVQPKWTVATGAMTVAVTSEGELHIDSI